MFKNYWDGHEGMKKNDIKTVKYILIWENPFRPNLPQAHPLPTTDLKKKFLI